MRSFISQTLKYSLGIFFLFIGLVSFAQLKADFTADQPAGCSPLLVSFSNTTIGASANVTYKWDFGNGNSSTKKDAGATYFDEKTYTVTLTATDGGQTSSKTMTITVYKKPVVNFSASPAKGCSPLPVAFTSSSTAGDGSIASYFWDFGDGATQGTSESQISHTYNFAQKTTVSLTVTNNHGCFNTLEKKQIVEVLGSMKGGFSASKTVLCAVNETTTFNNTSTGPGILSYAWDFGDGKTSTDKNPTHAYDKKGVYTVTLTVKNADGCLDKVVQTDYINVANYTVDFNVPSLICENTQATFNDISTNGSSNTTWQIDGAYAYNYYGSYFYYTFNAGSHKIKLTNTYGTCTASKEKNFTVNAAPNIQGFSASFGSLCGVPVTIQFKDTTKDAKSWLWDFNSPYGVTATTQNPSHTYNSEGYYRVKLAVINSVGCSSEVTQFYRIGKPTVNINIVSSTSPSWNSGCPGFTMIFGANVISGDDEITDYKWEFPDDGSISTSLKPKHTFNKAGTYRVKLAYTTKNGCTDVTYSDYIYVYEKPKADFVSLSGTTICGNTPVNFSDQSIGTVTNWSWDFGDYNYGYTGSPNVPTHQYYDTGKYTVTLIAYNGTCADTAIKDNYIKVLPPFPSISGVMNTCDGTRGLITFSQSSRYALSWKWDFDDGTTKTLGTDESQVTHNYTKTGSYNVVLTTTNGQCSVRDSATAYVLLKQSPKLSSSKTEVCSQNEIDITVNNLETNPAPNYYYKYTINNLKYGDGSDFNGSIYPAGYGWDTIYNGHMSGFDNKKKDIYAIIYSEYFGCFDTTNVIPLLIKGPISDYKITTDNVCYKSPVVFKDESKAQNGVAITKWDWDFGDGTYQSSSSGGSVPHTYSNPGFYYASLTVTDADGCINSTPFYYDYAEVNGPKASFYSSEQSVSPGTYIYFYNTTNTYNTYNTALKWDFGDGTTTTDYYYPTHAYSNIGVDTVKLFASDETTGCRDTAIQLIYVKNVNTSFTFTTSYINNNSCPPLLAQFQNTSSNANYVSWDFGDGSVADNQNFPSHTYYQPGNYKVTLYGYGDNNAIDSTVDYVTVKGPYAALSADVLNGCNTASVTLTAKASGATSYTWDFADGTLQQTTDTFGVHTYTNAGTFIPSLIMKDGYGCSATFSLKDTIVIDTLKIQSINKTPVQVCDSGFVSFNPVVASIAADEMHKPLQYHWNFGTSNPADTSNINQPTFFYNQLGKYGVKLKVTSPYGCVNQFTDSINVVEKAKGTINGPAEICENGSAIFTATSSVSTVTWSWDFKNGNTSSSQNPSTQTFTKAKDYMVSLIVTHSGCSDTTYSNLTVHPIPKINILPKEPVICLGNSIQLTAHDGTAYQWSPNQNINDTTIANPVVNPSATTTYFAKATNEFTCENTDSVSVLVVQPFTVQLDPVSYACKGIGVELHAEGADIYKWSGEGLNDYNISNPFTNPQTTTTYTVVGYDKYGCFTDTATTSVEIKPLPTVTAAPDQITLAGSTITLQANASSDVVSWDWSPPTYLSCTTCASPESSPRSNITYTVTVTNNYNCTAKDSINIKLVCAESIVKIPNSFTPNHDALNDWFTVLGKGIKLVKHIIVFNRWGHVVYRRDNIQPNDHSAGWDGKSEGIDMPSGVYVYIAEIICDTGDVFTYKGTVTLIR